MTLTARLISLVAGTGVALALAIMGRGGWAAFFAVDALKALTVVLCVLVVAAFFAGGNLSRGVREDRGNRWVLPVFAVISLLDTWLPAWADRNEIWIIDGDTVRWVGVLLFAAGGALRLWPVHVLGHRFSGLVAIQADHALVTDGIYRTIRNPSYVGLLITTLGWGLAFRSAVGVLLTACLLPPLVARICAEEALLQARFGDEYTAYRARTSRLIPGIW